MRRLNLLGKGLNPAFARLIRAALPSGPAGAGDPSAEQMSAPVGSTRARVMSAAPIRIATLGVTGATLVAITVREARAAVAPPA
jgi:hypothetical protein